MTPFDGAALLAMLRAFYPVVSVAQLQAARRERPEYFGAGVLFGTKGEKLRLADGRVFDLIFAAGAGPGVARWQVIDVTDEAGSVPSPWPLEDGPLRPLDDDAAAPPATAETFEALVAGELEAFGASDAVLDAAAVAVTELGAVVGVDDGSGAEFDGALEHHAAMRQALEVDDPAPELEAAGLTRGTIDAALTDYDEPVPPDIPEPVPGEPPVGEDDGKPPPQEF